MTQSRGDQKKKSKNRKRKAVDQTYHPHRPTKRRKIDGDDHNVLRLRTDNRKETETGETIKTAVIIHEDAIAGLDKNDLENIQFGDVTPNRPVKTIIYDGSSPIAIKTPGQTVLPRTASIGAATMFANTRKELFSKQEEPTISPIATEFYASEEYKNIKKITNQINKIQKTTITSDSLKKVKKECIDSGKKRSTSQNAQMVEIGAPAKNGSANKYVDSLKLYDGKIRCEWLHLVAYSFIGKAGQHADNLVAGSEHANTQMMSVEKQVKKLAKIYKEVNIIVTADLIPNTHVAKKINFLIITMDFSIKFQFDPAATDKPHYTLDKYISKIIEKCVEKAKDKQTNDETTSSTPKPKR